MRAYSTNTAPVTPIFCDLDAKELLMLYGMFERALRRSLHVESLGLIDEESAQGLVGDQIELATAAYDACMRRVASISATDGYVLGMPMKHDWQKGMATPLA